MLEGLSEEERRATLEALYAPPKKVDAARWRLHRALKVGGG